MDINQKARGPIGRGAMLRRLTESAANTSSNSDDSRSNISSSTSNESLLDVTTSDPGYRTSSAVTSLGRGRMLQRLQLAQESVSNDSFQLDSAPKPFGKGRGALLNSLKQKNNTPSEQSEESIQSIDEGIENLSIEEELEPVIRMGKSG